MACPDLIIYNFLNINECCFFDHRKSCVDWSSLQSPMFSYFFFPFFFFSIRYPFYVATVHLVGFMPAEYGHGVITRIIYFC